ncbi:ABC transporter [Sphingomonas ginkgonis]|uniref:ABC transporter n=1 Tax=Sphingomonas ginkgonis TaxID=2315330 RepID=A0A429V890_9SPHN|nr:ABC-type transport auxiliary lipoprotein family protein [Sphingomonas ginkgonis]RST30087.1 ABC transporter [Sphingomonas ginkgonis]
MSRTLRWTFAAGAALALSACGGLLGGGKPPAHLYTLSPEATAPTDVQRSASAGEAITVNVPVTGRELRSNRVPVQEGPTSIAYVANMTLIDSPDRLLQDLISETLRRTTGRVVMNPRQATFDPGLTVSGELRRFGYDATARQVMVTYDAALSTQGGTRVETRRFEASAPADGTVTTVAPALNRAANQVASDVARWVAGPAR